MAMAKEKKAKRQNAFVEGTRRFFGDIENLLDQAYRDTILRIPELIEKSKNLRQTNLELGLYHLAHDNLSDARLRFWMIDRLGKGDSEAKFLLGMCALGEGDEEKARSLFNHAQEMDAGMRKASLMLKAMDDPEQVTAIGADLLAEYFQNQAQDLENSYLNEERFKAPALLLEAVKKHAPDAIRLRMLDLGCATGANGVRFRLLADHVTGVDWAPDFVEQCRELTIDERAVYDDVEIDDALAFLAHGQQGRFDLITAAHSLVFYRSVEEAVTKCADALAPDGLLACTFSATYHEEEPSGTMNFHPQYEIMWFDHDTAAVKAAAEKAGLSVLQITESEVFDNVKGLVCLFRKPKL